MKLPAVMASTAPFPGAKLQSFLQQIQALLPFGFSLGWILGALGLLRQQRALVSYRLRIVILNLQSAVKRLLGFGDGAGAALAEVLEEVSFAELSDEPQIVRVRGDV